MNKPALSKQYLTTRYSLAGDSMGYQELEKHLISQGVEIMDKRLPVSGDMQSKEMDGNKALRMHRNPRERIEHKEVKHLSQLILV